MGSTGIVDYLGKFSFMKIYPFGYISALGFIIFFGVAIIKYRLMDIRVAVTRTTIFILVYALVLGIPIWLYFKTGSAVLGFFLMFGFATVGPYVYAYLKEEAEKRFTFDQRQYHFLVSLKDKLHIIDESLKIIRQKLNPETAGFYVFVDDEKIFKLGQVMGKDGRFPEAILLSDELVYALRLRREVVLVDGVNLSAEEIFKFKAKEWAVEMFASVSHNEALLGSLS